MYEYVTVEKTPHEYADLAGPALGYYEVRVSTDTRDWHQPLDRPLKKYDYHPAVISSNRTLQVRGRDWMVNWYMHDGHLDGLAVVGWPDEELVRRLCHDIWQSPGLWTGIVLARDFLTQHPEYRAKPPGPKTSKRLAPREEAPK